ncbi:PREDICTED: calcium-activated potassium channel subunit beta-3 [Hipposideros armiger]|uniref:Calcium-activated potassium channel subunit beta n=1 Tax=Hipposideros armiger TaxID=186990 RepID=A0A8B7Q2A0_HIPAR|nr:PREDICTED: calcium-activated potassium channel subunit beta-3 [Hipposideros armiger]
MFPLLYERFEISFPRLPKDSLFYLREEEKYIPQQWRPTTCAQEAADKCWRGPSHAARICNDGLLSSNVLLVWNNHPKAFHAQCFYTPKCHRDRNDLLNSALDIKEFFDHKNGTPFSCFYSPDSKSEDVILIKKYDQTVIFHCVFWPSLTLLGGALIVGMVRLTQYLSLLCEKYSTALRREAGGKVPHVEQHRFTLWGEAKEGAEKCF